jgi:hypothetical protein
MRRFTRLIHFLILAIILSAPALSDDEPSKLTVRKIDLAAHNPAAAVEDIRTAFTSGLPLAAEWNIGQTGRGWTLDYQVDLIRQGYRILPTIYNPLPNGQGNNAEILGKWLLKNRAAIEQLREWKLPICLRSPNWLSILTSKPPSKYRVPFDRLDESPLAWRIDESGKPDDMPIADPMGPVSRWREMGTDVATSLWVKALAEIYPDPPLIYFLENNEGARLKAKTFFGPIRIPVVRVD